MKVRKKPVEVEAVQLTWQNWPKMCSFAGVGNLEDGKPEGGYAIPDNAASTFSNKQESSEHVLALAIPTTEGVMIGVEGDWIIKGVQGELYPCKPKIFDTTYERLDLPVS